MATIAQARISPGVGDERFFLRGAIVMTILIVAGFSYHLAMGRSSFSSPLRVHAHAVVFMGWVGIYLLQNIFAASGRMNLHRKLGWIAAAWLVPMIILGFVVTVAMVRLGNTPFFFRPVQFLIFDPVAILTFAGLTLAAIALRRRTQWHRRLHFCAMTILLHPALGRLLPGPALVPWAWESLFAVSLLFPIAGMAADFRRSGQVHPAWHVGIGTMIASFLLVEALTYGPLGAPIHSWVVSGSPGEAVPPFDFPPPPGR